MIEIIECNGKLYWAAGKAGMGLKNKILSNGKNLKQKILLIDNEALPKYSNIDLYVTPYHFEESKQNISIVSILNNYINKYDLFIINTQLFKNVEELKNVIEFAKNNLNKKFLVLEQLNLLTEEIDNDEFLKYFDAKLYLK